MNPNFYYKDENGNLEMYQRLIQYWTMIFNQKEKIAVLDNMNFNISLFPQIIKPEEVSLIHPIEPGYTSPDGFTEMNRFIRELEYQRLVTKDPDNSEKYRTLIEKAGMGCGNGCSNVMNGVLNSILKLTKNEFTRANTQPEIILILPNYTVYAAQLSNLKSKATPRYVHTRKENGFLPTYEEIKGALTERTVAIVITYPNNPAQTTYEGEMVDELRKIIHLCQEEEVFLIADNIYQDLIFPRERFFTEIFNLTDSVEYLIKVYGSSKDTPFFSGYRTGYWLGDARIMDNYRYFISSTENSMNTLSLAMFALNLYFKRKRISGAGLTVDDMEAFNQGVFGWSQVIDPKRLLENFLETNLFEKYIQRIQTSDGLQECALKEVQKFVDQSDCFIDSMNQNIGNVFFIRMNPDYFIKNDDELFKYLYYTAKCGVLPGNVFGMPLQDSETWFRITLLHDSIENIISNLQKVEDTLRKNRPLVSLRGERTT